MTYHPSFYKRFHTNPFDSNSRFLLLLPVEKLTAFKMRWFL